MAVPVVRTWADMARRIARLTLAAELVVLPITALVVYTLHGADLSSAVDGYHLLAVALPLSFSLVALAVPLLSVRGHVALRELFLAREELDRIAHVDSLTLLLNRRGFDRAALNTLNQFPNSNLIFSLLLCDLDHFKGVNDKHGHHVGDEALRLAADLLRAATAPINAPTARQGGEEFLVLLPGHDAAAAVAFAEMLRMSVELAFRKWQSGESPITISIGVAAAPVAGCNLETMIRMADAALYQAKRAGRNRVVAHAQAALASLGA